MDPAIIIGAILSIVALVALAASIAEIWKRGIGSKIFLSLVSIGGPIAFSYLTSSPGASFAAREQTAACFFPFSLLFALLFWIALASVGIVGEGGFVSEFMKELRRP